MLVKRRQEEEQRKTEGEGGGLLCLKEKMASKMTSKKFASACRIALWVGVITNYDTLTREDELLLVFVEMRC